MLRLVLRGGKCLGQKGERAGLIELEQQLLLVVLCVERGFYALCFRVHDACQHGNLDGGKSSSGEG